MDSKATAICRTDSSVLLLIVIISVTSGVPLVMVHVLSKIIVFTLQSISSGSHHLIRIPFSAHLPVPTISAVGVANHNAHGQAITITAAKYINEAVNHAPRKKNQMTKTINAMMMTVGTNIHETLSANHWIGALDHCASRINFMI